MQGKSINGFVLQRVIDTGGMAEVWYAENEIGMKAAVKMLLPKYCADDSVKLRFLNEAKVMGKLDHPNICKVLGFGTIDSRPAIVMDYLDGLDMRNRLKQGQHFSEEEQIRWWNQLVSALNYTHKKGIVHRDIKPGNIFITDEGNIKMLDFGIAKVRESIGATQTGQKLGTLMYMSPEQVRDSKHIDYHTDIYSLAVTFVHLLTGKTPYDSDTSSDFEIMTNIVNVPLDLSGLPEGWQGFLAPYLEKDQEKRPELRPFEPIVPHTPSTKGDEEGTVVDNQPPSDPKPLTSPQVITDPLDKPSKPPKKGGGAWVFIGVFFMVMAAVLAVLVFMPGPESKEYYACKTVNDYRTYISNYGTRGKFYAEANQIVEQYVADSIAKAKVEAINMIDDPVDN